MTTENVQANGSPVQQAATTPDNRTLEELGPGDLVYRYVRMSRTPEVLKISRVTATQIIIGAKNGVGTDYELRYNRKTGRSVGESSYYTHYIKPMTGKDAEKIRKEAELYELSMRIRELAGHVSKVPLEHMKRVDAERLRVHLAALRVLVSNLKDAHFAEGKES